jgi:hypothetical protein
VGSCGILRGVLQATVRQEVHIVREVLEGAFSPELATQLMFEALQAVGDVPTSADAVLQFCRGPLAQIVEDVVGADARTAVVLRLEQVLVEGNMTGTDIPIDVDFEPEPSLTMVMPTVWREPVSVLVVSCTGDFAERLHAALGASRVTVATVDGEMDVRKGAFQMSPLLVVVDATAAPTMERGSIAAVFRGLPDHVLPVVWGAETEYGDGLANAMRAAGIGNAISLRYGEGIPAFLDLVLARYQP